MIERDWFMREIQQLAQFLQQVILQKKEGQFEEAQRTIRQAIGEVDEDGPDDLRTLSLAETLRFCRYNGTFEPERARALAGLLYEEGDLLEDPAEAEKSYARALLLYRAVMREQRTAVPWDIGAKMSDLKAEVSTKEIREIERLVEQKA